MSKEKKRGLETLNKGFQMPDTYVIIFLVVVLAALLTYLIPQGMYSTEEVSYVVNGVEKTRTVIEDGSFQYVLDENGEPLKQGVALFEPYGEVGMFNYVFEGMVSGDKWGSAVGVIAFILVIGGAFGIILRTGAVETGILNMIGKTQGREKLLVPLLFVLFSLGGAVFGMGEEALPFAMILIPLVIAMGYDSVVGILITYVATQIGFGTSWMNPFSVAIAQGIAGIPVFSGATFRIVMWVLFTGVGAAMTMIYATRIKKDPIKSVAYDSDEYFRKDFEEQSGEIQKFTLGHALVLLTILAGMVWVVWGVMKNGYYIPELATQFFIMGIVAGMIGILFKLNNMTVNDMAQSFKTGVSDLVGAAMIVGMAQGIMLVLGGADPTSGTVLNTILNGLSSAFVGLSATAAAVLMYVFQSVFNFFVVSGSGQAALTMPIMAPLADLLGVTRQTAVLAFQLGDALTNLIVPTSGCLMGALAIARLDWAKWVKFMIKFLGVLYAMAVISIIIASVSGF
ncbi:putative basic amino acid antiporter YfcC [Sinanaerobacter sp. ZZT-01]|uniref:putative basic amino acid antiporter YfcC n=1 Tax=Sinanaerobacter sp. ZZT-01 TaxID=3111540 RepID=UPI002D782CEE|nr:putative basic amino acid antiporter YfcC [Sinanaerobacter sp. ZZT-01]WRR94775.1 putative basic amino acid antiporter YfcC [Sinanaerobacter sp. ZZT-01]